VSAFDFKRQTGIVSDEGGGNVLFHLVCVVF
jgi:hypothetical protein